MLCSNFKPSFSTLLKFLSSGPLIYCKNKAVRLWGEKKKHSFFFFFFRKTSYAMVFPLPPSIFLEDHIMSGRGGEAHLQQSLGCCSSHIYDFRDASRWWSSHGYPKIRLNPQSCPLNLIPNLSKLLSLLSAFSHWSTGPISHCRAPGPLQQHPRCHPVCSLPEQA